MPRYVAFLRGMNLGRRRIKNEELAACFEAMGFDGVQTFLASGNVIFDSSKRSASALQARVERDLEKALAYPVPTFLRTAAEVAAIAEAEPFDAAALKKSSGKPQVALLAAAPNARAKKTVLALSGDADRLAVIGRELFWLPAGKMSESELDLRLIERTFGAMTVRTRNTIDRIASKYL